MITRIFLFFALLVCNSSGSISTENCLSLNLAHQLPIWNSTEGNLFQSVPYVGAVFPADALTVPIPIGGRIVVVLYRMRSSKHIACGESAAVASEEVLRSVLEYTASSPDAHWTPSRQQRSMFGRVSVEGKVSNSAYYHLIRPRPEFVHEWHPKSALDISSTDEDLDFYWFELTPPLPATYSLTLHVDFVDCRGPLSELSSPYFVNASALDDYCKLVYGPAMRMSVTVSTEKYSVPLPTAWCELHAMEGGFWVYPAVMHGFKDSEVYRTMIPTWHTSSCLSLQNRSFVALRKQIFMSGDSNTRRTCNWIQNQNRVCTILHGDYIFPGYEYVDHNKQKFLKGVVDCTSFKEVYCALNIGHHMVDVSIDELRDGFLLPMVDVLNLTYGAHAKAQSSPLAVWSTTASHSTYLLKDKFGKHLHLMSNYYREAWQNQEIKRTVEAYCATTKMNRGCAYVDIFSPTLAIVDLSHSPGDPVHFSHGLYYNMVHDFIGKLLKVTEICNHANCNRHAPFSVDTTFYQSIASGMPTNGICIQTSTLRCPRHYEVPVEVKRSPKRTTPKKVVPLRQNIRQDTVSKHNNIATSSNIRHKIRRSPSIKIEGPVS